VRRSQEFNKNEVESIYLMEGRDKRKKEKISEEKNINFPNRIAE